jgi:ankyrin repeat protein
MAPCALAALPGGDDLLDELFADCSRPALARAKGLSRGWRERARRIMCEPSWQARHLTLPELLSLGSPPRVLALRIATHPHEGTKKEAASGWTALHTAVAHTAEAHNAAAHNAAAHTAAVGVAASHGVGGSSQGVGSSSHGERDEWLALVPKLLAACPQAAEARDAEGHSPLHLAARKGAPVGILRQLHAAYEIGPWQKVWRIMVLPRGGGGVYDQPEALHIGQLPLHCAASGTSSADCIRFLLSLYPPGAAAVDAAGQLPLHLAMSNPAASEEVVRCLLDAHPEAAQVPDHAGRLPVMLALDHRAGDSAVVRMIVDAYPAGAQQVLADLIRRKGTSVAAVMMALGKGIAVRPPRPPGQQQLQQQHQQPQPQSSSPLMDDDDSVTAAAVAAVMI